MHFAIRRRASGFPTRTRFDTFEASRLDWDERGREPHREREDLVRRLLAIRSGDLVTRFAGMRHGGEFLVEGEWLTVRWTLGDGSRLGHQVAFARGVAQAGGLPRADRAPAPPRPLPGRCLFEHAVAHGCRRAGWLGRRVRSASRWRAAMSDPHGALLRLCELHGVGTGYHDIWGKWVEAPEAALRALLGQLGVHVESAESIENALAQAHDSTVRRLIEPVALIDPDGGERECDDLGAARGWTARCCAGG